MAAAPNEPVIAMRHPKEQRQGAPGIRQTGHSRFHAGYRPARRNEVSYRGKNQHIPAMYEASVGGQAEIVKL